MKVCSITIPLENPKKFPKHRSEHMTFQPGLRATKLGVRL